MAKKTDTRPTDVKDLLKKFKKRYSEEPVVLSRERKILEHLVFAMFLEKASFGQAREAFVELQRYFIDWNEIRVSTADEIASVVSHTTEPKVVGERLRRILQWVFDKIYKFDLEDMRAKGREEVVEFLNSVPFSTPFINDYVSEFAFGGAVVPLDEYSMRVLRLLGLVVVKDNLETVPALKNAFKEVDARAFFFALHELGVELANKATSEEAINFLASIDPAVEKRSAEPLVKAEQTTDPREIARMLERNKRPQRPTMPIAGDPEDDSDDDKVEEEGIEKFINNEPEIPVETVEPEPSRPMKRGRKGASSLANEELNVSTDNTEYVNNDEVVVKKTARKRGGSKPTSSENVEEKEVVAEVEVASTPAPQAKAPKKEKKSVAKAETEQDAKPVKKAKKVDAAEAVEEAPVKKVKAPSKDAEVKATKKTVKVKKTVEDAVPEAPKKVEKSEKASSKKVEKTNKSEKGDSDKVEKPKSKSACKTRKPSSEPPDASESDVGKKTVKRSNKKK